MNGKKTKINKLHITAAVIAAAAVLTVVIAKFGARTEVSSEISVSSDTKSSVASNGKIYIPSDNISDGISFFDYTAADGTAMQYILVKDSDGEVRGALNTCQVCNGSPYAYFVADGDSVICRNCRNEFPIEVIGSTHGGCNPVPLDIKAEDGNYIVDAEYLDSISPAFSNWKKGI
ncbi:MAG: Fe-S-containing protein [Oscillospiraceae bacterium]